ncbi:MAG: hypothetical protein HY619_06515 [Thaumarchaeota archaeon]|nr:hypothetical protein [Nitrososphaerota archaeon]
MVSLRAFSRYDLTRSSTDKDIHSLPNLLRRLAGSPTYQVVKLSSETLAHFIFIKPLRTEATLVLAS